MTQSRFACRTASRSSTSTFPFTTRPRQEFPTAPHDSFLLANASYIAKKTGSDTVGAFLVDTGGRNIGAVAERLRQQLGTNGP